MTTILIDGAYVVGAGQNLTFTATTQVPVYTLEGPSNPSFTDNGSIQVSSSDGQASVVGISDDSSYFYSSSLVKIAQGATFTVAASGAGSTAYGYRDGSWSPALENDGLLSVAGAASAIGVAPWMGAGFVNTGTLLVWAPNAIGLMTQYGGNYSNTGLVEVDGVTRAAAFSIDQLGSGSTFSNQGVITATATSGASYGLFVGGSYSTTSWVTINNSGTITAQHAIYGTPDISPAETPSLHIFNSGTINGDITLGPGPYSDFPYTRPANDGEIFNTGAINGAVYLSQYGNDTYDGRGGTQTGGIYLGNGYATIYLGNDGETVHAGTGAAHVTGGTGADTFAGGALNDFVDAGAGGADVFDGGGGINTISFASAATGVTVSLALQGSAQASGVGAVTFSNFQNLTGSAHADHLTGDAHDNVIDGGGGDDLIDGGAGNNTVSFASAATGVTVSLASQGTAQATGAGSATLSNFQNLTGSAFSDHLTGDANDNIIDGGAGGVDVLDGAGGANTVSFASAAAAVTISLALQGSAQTVGSGSVSFTNFENLRGSAYADHLTGDASDNVIDGGGGDDVLDGGGGTNTLSFASATTGVNAGLALQGQSQDTGVGHVTATNFQNLTGSSFDDILRGDPGNNILTGGAGADTFVFAPNGGADTIADFSSAQGDKIDLTAFTNFNSVDAVIAAATSSGSDTVIDLGGGASLTLRGVAKSSLTSADFISPTIMPSGSTVTLASGQTANFVGSGPAATFVAAAGGKVINQGVVAISSVGAALGVTSTSTTAADPSSVLENDGTFTFTAATLGAPGYYSTSAVIESVTLKNNGLFSAAVGDTAVGASGDLINTGSYTVHGVSAATGVQDANSGGVVQNLAGATLSVSATSGPATGVMLQNGGEFDNAGVLTVTGSSQSTSGGVSATDHYSGSSTYAKVVNTGTITVTGGTSSYGVAVGGVLGVPALQYNLINSGTITAPISVYGSQFASTPAVIDNSGTLNGDLVLGQGGQILNTGVINGNVDFNYGWAFLDSTGGAVHGAVFIGPNGSSNSGRVLLGGEDNTVVIGSAGRNIVDGGGGTNTLSFSEGAPSGTTVSLIQGVTVSLLTQGVAQDTLGVGTLTFSNIQNLVGSTFSDHLIGGAGANTLTGGAGADLFVFAPGVGAETVTDFSHAEGDKIELLSSFSQFTSLASMLPAAHQVGADTVIAMGGGSLTLKNVALASLTATDFIFSAPKVGPGIGGTPVTGPNPYLAMMLTGTTGDDWLQGGISDDTLHGGAGSDYLVGGPGVNTATYDGAFSQYTVGFGGAGEVTVSGGPEGGTDVLVGIQRIQFKDGYLASPPASDTSGEALAFYSPSGSVIGPGLGGRPATGNLTISGTSGGDWLQGGSGNDTLHGGLGSDHLDGGAGVNTAVYDGAYRQYNLGAGGATVIGGPEGGIDDLVNIQRIQFLDGYLATSPTDTAGQVYRIYEATLGRAPDQEGLTNWVNSLNSGASLQSVVGGFVNSTEFQQVYGALDNAGFVTLLYHNVLHRAPDSGGLANWVGMLASGQDTRAQVVLGFSESPEDINALSAPVRQGLWIADAAAGEVARLYDTVLGRLPDASGLANWTSSLEAGSSLQSVANGFVGSQEFQSVYGSLNNTDFVTLLYHNVLHRDPDAGGLNNWVGMLQSGQETRAQVVVGFSESPEHITNTAPHIDSGIWLAS